ncbi:MAG: hypothetical protein GF320_21910 [Armatimonadia bacterium]|nr:hypothetical protein [Armatimonadia bacterium]
MNWAQINRLTEGESLIVQEPFRLSAPGVEIRIGTRVDFWGITHLLGEECEEWIPDADPEGEYKHYGIVVAPYQYDDDGEPFPKDLTDWDFPQWLNDPGLVRAVEPEDEIEEPEEAPEPNEPHVVPAHELRAKMDDLDRAVRDIVDHTGDPEHPDAVALKRKRADLERRAAAEGVR